MISREYNFHRVTYPAKLRDSFQFPNLSDVKVNAQNHLLNTTPEMFTFDILLIKPFALAQFSGS